MPITYNSSETFSEGSNYRVFANLSPDTSYPVGGYLIDPKKIRLQQINELTVPNNPNGVVFYFDKTTSKLVMGSSTGGGGIFTGNPMGNHTHLLTPRSTGLPNAEAGYYVYISGASGPFTVGETITGGSSGATGVVLTYVAGLISYTPGVGRLDVLETITGGTSGNTAVVQSLPFVVFQLTTPTTIVECVYDDDITGRQFSPSVGFYTPYICTTTTVVGTFTAGETITGGTSGATAQIKTIGIGGSVLEWSLYTGQFQIGETVTGGTSGATAVIFSIRKDRLFRHLVTANQLHFDYDIAPQSLFAVYQTENDSAAASAGTPTGTVVAGPGGGFAEFPGGTNVAAILPSFDIIGEGI